MWMVCRMPDLMWRTTCPIPKGCSEIWMEVMALESGIWLPVPPRRSAITEAGCRFEVAKAVQRDDLAWEVFDDFVVLLRLFRDEYERQPELHTPFGRALGHNSPFDRVSVLCRRLARHLDRVIMAFEREGLRGAKTELKKAYADLSGSGEKVSCVLTGHAHIDLVWLWSENAAEFKAVHTFASMNRLMDEYPEFRFGYSKPASYRAVGRRSPALMQKVRARIRQGRWETLGASEVESDTQIACGEGLVRSLLLGQEGFSDLQGKPSEILWLPDVFGYTGCLPQILKQTGVKYFFTTKLHWGSITLFPYSSFIWRGSDGSEILSHVSQGMGYNQNVTPEELRRGAEEYRQSDVHDRFLMPSGFGDGGGGATPEMCERARRLSNLAGVPPARWGRGDEFFATLETVRDKLPVHRGELCLQYHRGVLTTHGNLKRAFRGAERGLQIWEAASCACGAGPIDRKAWQRVVFAQFHDYIPGSSVARVYETGVPELEGIARSAEKKAINLLAGNSRKSTPCLFNPLPIERILIHEDRLVRIGPLCGVPVHELQNVEAPPVKATAYSLSNGRVTARFDKRGRIAFLTVDGCAVATHAPLAELMIYPDLAHAFEAWDIDRSTLANGIPAPAARHESTHCDGLRGEVIFSLRLSAKSKCRIHYILEAGSSVLRIEYELDWGDPQRLLKVLFPTAYDGTMARFGDPFGSTLRSQQPGKPHEEAQWEVAGNRWAMVADDGETEGLFVVTEAKYGWSARSGTLGLSLLRSPIIPSQEKHAAGGFFVSGDEYSDIKTHHIRLAVGRFDQRSERGELPAALADTLFTPCVTYHGQARSVGLLGIEGGNSLVPCWAMPGPKGEWTLRLHETLGRRGDARLKLEKSLSARKVDLRCQQIEGRSASSFSYEPYEIVSLK